MRINLKEKNHFHSVFETLLNRLIGRPIEGISIDSRNIKKNDLFIAIKGENFDGNDFIDQAIDNGASYSLSSKKNKSDKHIYVENLNDFMKELTVNWLKDFEGKIVGITGSNGKTTTKDLISHLLQSKLKVQKTRGNYNTSISVPLSILSFSLKTDIYVLELGANKVGDIKYLSSIVNPDYGVITSIAAAHLDGFGSIRNIEKEKKSILDFSSKKYNFNEIEPNDLKINLKGTRSDIFIKNFQIAAHIAHDIFNDLKINDFDENSLMDCFKNFEIPKGRGNVLFINKIRVIDDSYNANPESVKAALDYLNRFKEHRKIFVFGDMKELGENGDNLHKEIGQYADGKANILLTVGKLAKNAQSNSKNFALSLHFNDNFSLLEKLNELLTDGDVVLIKGSRSMHLDQLVNELKKC
tara:strand:+ start:1373 stop:2608 length:1236 start_codon:yes stop_codon:yes gene_type:complete